MVMLMVMLMLMPMLMLMLMMMLRKGKLQIFAMMRISTVQSILVDE